MPPDYADFAALKNRKIREHQARHHAELAQLSQAEVSMKKLTGQPEWDAFVQMLEAKAQETEAALINLRARLCYQAATSDELYELRRRVAGMDARLVTLQEVQELPASLLKKEDTSE